MELPAVGVLPNKDVPPADEVAVLPNRDVLPAVEAAVFPNKEDAAGLFAVLPNSEEAEEVGVPNSDISTANSRILSICNVNNIDSRN